jgi:hypothetical protein
MSNAQPLSRPRYFTGKLLTAEDLQSEQEYMVEKQRRHNRALHGYGVVWGLQVRVLDGSVEEGGGQKIIVGPGFAIDHRGNEIVVPEAQERRLPSEAVSQAAWLCLSYSEDLAEYVPVPGDPGKGENGEASRIVEAFKLCLLTQPGSDCSCEGAILLARLQRTLAGWDLERGSRPPRLRRLDEKRLWTAAALGAAAGVLLGLAFGKR